MECSRKIYANDSPEIPRNEKLVRPKLNNIHSLLWNWRHLRHYPRTIDVQWLTDPTENYDTIIDITRLCTNIRKAIFGGGMVFECEDLLCAILSIPYLETLNLASFDMS